jgi:hypothetical protein
MFFLKEIKFVHKEHLNEFVFCLEQDDLMRMFEFEYNYLLNKGNKKID